jgi:hypothetical protein
MKNELMFNRPSASRRKIYSTAFKYGTNHIWSVHTFLGLRRQPTLTNMWQLHADWVDLVERTFLFIPNVQYFMQKKCVNRQFKKCPYRNNRFMQNFCYKMGVVATKLATVKSGIRWWSIKPVNRCEWYHRRGWESWVKTFVKAAGPCQWHQKSTQSNPYRVQIDDPHFFVIKPTRCTNFTNLFCH